MEWKNILKLLFLFHSLLSNETLFKKKIKKKVHIFFFLGPIFFLL